MSSFAERRISPGMDVIHADRDHVNRWAQAVVIFGVVPLVVGWWVPPEGWFVALWSIAGCAWWIRRTEPATPGVYRAFTSDHSPDERVFAKTLRRVLVRFSISALVLTTATVLLAPEHLFEWPRTRPWLWLAAIALYPFISVIPQELIYRRFFFERIGPLVRRSQWCIAGSAVTFAAMHAIYRNVPAVALTLFGGWFFADTYRRTPSLKLVCLEHALYGNLVFTIGLGGYFSPAMTG
jgi:membrane protease YdiL (CAAX protease family)